MCRLFNGMVRLGCWALLAGKEAPWKNRMLSNGFIPGIYSWDLLIIVTLWLFIWWVSRHPNHKAEEVSVCQLGEPVPWLVLDFLLAWCKYWYANIQFLVNNVKTIFHPFKYFIQTFPYLYSKSADWPKFNIGKSLVFCLSIVWPLAYNCI